MTKIAHSTTFTLMAAAFGLSLLAGIAAPAPAAACYIGKPCPQPPSRLSVLKGLKLEQIKAVPSNPRPSVNVAAPRATLATAKRR